MHVDIFSTIIHLVLHTEATVHLKDVGTTLTPSNQELEKELDACLARQQPLPLLPDLDIQSELVPAMILPRTYTSLAPAGGGGQTTSFLDNEDERDPACA